MPVMRLPERAANAFTIVHNGRTNRIITSVRVSPAFNPAAPPDPLPVDQEFKALWDTGATSSVLTTATVQALGLTPVGQVMVNHAGGSSSSLTYVVNFLLPNNVGIAGIHATECPNNGDPFGVIIGMDVITMGDLSLSNAGGRTVMSFRWPSLGGIDYVKEINRTQFAGIGRNDPCPCGRKDSQGHPIKYKYCHGKPGRTQP